MKPETKTLMAMNKYIVIKKLLNEMDSIKGNPSLRILFIDYIEKISIQYGSVATLISFRDFIRNDLSTSSREQISTAVLAVSYREKNLWVIEKLLNHVV